MWERCPSKKTDWIKLKGELEQALEDPLIRTKWKTDQAAYKWEAGVDLQTYYTNVMKYVDKYDTEIASCPAAVSHQYYTRFLNGLPEEYKAQVHLSLPTSKEDIHKARDICQKKQSLKESSSVSMGTDVGAAAFDSGTEDRIKKNEMDIAKLTTELSKANAKTDHARAWSQDRNQPASQPTSYTPRPGRGYPSNRGNRFNSNNSTFNRGRWDRLKAIKQQRYRGNSGSQDGRSDGPSNSDSRSQYSGQKRVHYADQEKEVEASAIETDVESAVEHDETINDFMAMREDEEADEFQRYLDAKDELGGN